MQEAAPSGKPDRGNLRHDRTPQRATCQHDVAVWQHGEQVGDWMHGRHERRRWLRRRARRSQHPHPEAMRQPSDGLPDPSQPHDPERLAAKLAATRSVEAAARLP